MSLLVELFLLMTFQFGNKSKKGKSGIGKNVMFFQQSLEGIVDMAALLFCLQWG